MNLRRAKEVTFMMCLQVPSVFERKSGQAAIGPARLQPAQRNAIGLAAHQAGDEVIGPGIRSIQRLDFHPLGLRSLSAVGQGLLDDRLFAQCIGYCSLRRRGGQSEPHLCLQQKREHGAHVLAGERASVAVPTKPFGRVGRDRQRRNCLRPASRRGERDTKQIASLINIFAETDLASGALQNQLLPVIPQKLCGLFEAEL